MSYLSRQAAFFHNAQLAGNGRLKATTVTADNENIKNVAAMFPLGFYETSNGLFWDLTKFGRTTVEILDIEELAQRKRPQRNVRPVHDEERIDVTEHVVGHANIQNLNNLLLGRYIPASTEMDTSEPMPAPPPTIPPPTRGPFDSSQGASMRAKPTIISDVHIPKAPGIPQDVNLGSVPKDQSEDQSIEDPIAIALASNQKITDEMITKYIDDRLALKGVSPGEAIKRGDVVVGIYRELVAKYANEPRVNTLQQYINTVSILRMHELARRE